MKADINIPPHGGQLHRIAERFGIGVSALMDFSANINPEGPPALVVQALKEALEEPAVLSQYPDLEEIQLRLSISDHIGVASEGIVAANGFVPLLDAVLRGIPIHRCLLPVPAFSEYRNALERSNIAVTPYQLDQEQDFRYQPEDLLKTLKTGRHDALLLANPQNPSGVLCNREDLITLIKGAAKDNIYVLLDEAFIDYAAPHSVVGEIRLYPNLVIFRSVTKFYGIPGLRVAYAVAEPDIANKIQKQLPPWPITTMAAIAIRAALTDRIYAERSLALNDQRRDFLTNGLNALGFHTYPSAANFVLIRFRSIDEAVECWQQLILNHKIVLRHCTTFEGLAHNHLRCAIRDDRANSDLIRALAQRQY